MVPIKKIIPTGLLAATALAVVSSLSACGRSNTLPPVSYFPPAGQQPYAPGLNPNGGTGNTLPNGDDQLPGDNQGTVGSIVGRVQDANGRPLHHVKVFIEGQPHLKTRSDKGEYVLLNVPVGSHTLVFQLGQVEKKVSVQVRPNMAVPPEGNPVRLEGPIGEEYLGFVEPNKQLGAFKVDQDMLHQWQARGVVAAGTMVYISAVDHSQLFKKGTVIQVDTAGNNWKDLAKAWLGLRHPMNKTTQGLTLTSSNGLLVADEKDLLYTVDTTKGKVQKVKADGAFDIAAGGGQVYIYSTRGLERSDETGVSRSLVAGVNASGGVGADKEGNGYVPVGDKIQKISKTGESKTIISTQLNTPLDVAIDDRNGDIYVLDKGEIKRFTKQGEYLVSFQSGAQEPVAIDLDEEGNLYVADFGTTHRNSQVIKFGPAKPAPEAPKDDTEEAATEETTKETASTSEEATDETAEETATLPDVGTIE